MVSSSSTYTRVENAAFDELLDDLIERGVSEPVARSALLVYLFIVRFAFDPERPGIAFPSQDTIAKMLHFQRKYVIKLMEVLKKYGWIKKVRRQRDGHGTWEYLLPRRLEMLEEYRVNAAGVHSSGHSPPQGTGGVHSRGQGVSTPGDRGSPPQGTRKQLPKTTSEENNRKTG